MDFATWLRRDHAKKSSTLLANRRMPAATFDKYRNGLKMASFLFLG
jgi:hypothetical protein